MHLKMVLAVVIAALIGAVRIEAQVVTGRVIDEGTGSVVSGVTVSLLRRGEVIASVSTDSAGRFHVLLTDSNAYRLRAERIGYGRTESPEIVLGRGGTTEVELRIRVQGIPLEPLIVRGHSAPERGRLGFERRRELGKGVFLTDDSLKLRYMAHPVDALMGVPGISIRWTRYFKPVVKTWVGNQCLTYYVDHHTDPFVIGSGGFNGRYRTWSLELVRAADIVAVEVYANGTDVPAELVTTRNYNSNRPFVEQTGRCGVVRIWTKYAW